MNNTNNASARDSYVQAKKMFFKAFIGNFSDKPGFSAQQQCAQFVEQLKLSQGEIRLEVGLSANQTLFAFGVNPNQANTGNVQFATERRLPLQDSLCVNEYGVFVGIANTGGEVPVADPTSAAFSLRTYGNTIDFTAAAAASIDEQFYSNGSFIMKCNNDVLVPYRGLFNHWYKPITQQTAALGAASPGDQIRGAEDGTITDEPNIVLIGSKNNIPQIELPQPLGTVDVGTRAILILRGIYAQNSTVVS